MLLLYIYQVSKSYIVINNNKQTTICMWVCLKPRKVTSMSWPYHDTVTVYLPTSNVKLG